MWTLNIALGSILTVRNTANLISQYKWYFLNYSYSLRSSSILQAGYKRYFLAERQVTETDVSERLSKLKKTVDDAKGMVRCLITCWLVVRSVLVVGTELFNISNWILTQTCSPPAYWLHSQGFAYISTAPLCRHQEMSELREFWHWVRWEGASLWVSEFDRYCN